MSIDKISGISSFASHPDQMKKDNAHKNAQAGIKKTSAGGEEKKQVRDAASQSKPRFNSEDLHKAAQQTKEQIEDYMTRVKSQSSGTEKFYPPFPPGSEGRIQMLKNFPVFREQIERLSASPTNADFGEMKSDGRIQDLQAEIKSMEIRASLTEERMSGITVNQSRLTGLY